jgi:hypothetical protein
LQSLPFLILLAFALLTLGSRAEAVTYVSSTPIAGDSVAVTVTLTDVIGGNAVDVSVSIPTGQGDLLGFFGNVTPESILPQMGVTSASGIVTQWQFSANHVSKVGGGNVMNPVGTWDFGLRLGSQGSGGGAVTLASFQLTGAGLTVASLVNASTQGWRFGIRVQSTLGPGGSAKIGVSASAQPVGEAPTIDVTVPAAGLLTSQTPITASGTVAGTAPLAVGVNGVAAAVTGGTWTAQVPLVEGANTLTGTATNTAGTATDTVAVTLDTAPPVVTITAPADGTQTTSAQITVTGTVVDASPIASFTVNGVAVPLASGAFTTTVPLAAGANPITAIATDAAGNTGQDTTAVTHGTVPTITITSPANGLLTRLTPITVTGTVTGDPAPSVSVNGVAATVTGGSWTASVPLVEGTNSLTATATNAFGNATAAVSVTLDTTPPLVAISSPANGSQVTAQPIAVTGGVIDASPIVSLALGGSALPPDTAFSTTTSLVLGPNTLTVTATDAAGNTGSTSVVVTLAAAGPPLAITIETPPDGAIVSTSVIPVAGTVSDPQAFVAVNGFYGVVTGAQYVAPAVYLVEGLNTLVATATRGTETVSHPITVTYNAPPAVVISSPRDGATLRDPTTDVEGVVDDPTAFVDVNGVVASVLAGGRFIARGVPLDPGANTLTARAIDPLGASGTDRVAVTRDAAAAGAIRVLALDYNNRLITGAPLLSGLADYAALLERFVPDTPFDPPILSGGLDLDDFHPPLERPTFFPQEEILVLAEQPGTVDVSATYEGEASPFVGPVSASLLPIEQLSPDYLSPSDLANPEVLTPPDLDARWFAFVPLLRPCIIDSACGASNQVAESTRLRLRATAGAAEDELALYAELDRAPEFEIVTPTAGSVVPGPTLSVTGTVHDDGPLLGILHYAVRDTFGVMLGEGTVPLQPDPPGAPPPPRDSTRSSARFTIPGLVLGIGFHTIELRFWDSLGQLGQGSTYVEVDPAVPAVALVSPRDGEALLEDTAHVSLNFAAPTTLVFVNGAADGRTFPAGLASDVLALPLALGANAVQLDFTAADGGASFSLSFTVFRVDAIAPIRITAPSAGEYLNTASVAATVVAPLGTALVQINGVNATRDADGVSHTALLPVREGRNPITAVAYPSGQSATATVVGDFHPPSLELLAPSSGGTLAASAFVAGRVDEEATVDVVGPAGAVRAQSVLDAERSNPSLDVFVYAFTAPDYPLDSGSNALLIRATDRAGNVSELALPLLRQEVALRLVSPTSGTMLATLSTDLVLDVLADSVLDAVFAGDQRLPTYPDLLLAAGTQTLSGIPLVPGTNEIRIVSHRAAGGGPEVVTSTVVSTATDFATVTGIVTDENTGAPLADALVDLDLGGARVQVVTDSSGRFTTRVRPGPVLVIASRPGSAVASASTSPAAGETATVNLALAPTGLSALTNELVILVPPPGTVTDFEQLTVVGSVLSPASSVTVNGVAAQVVGHRFTARHVPLAMGVNTLTVIATAPGAQSVTKHPTVERSDTPLLAVRIFSPPDRATIPGSGLVVRGFVSTKAARTLAGDSFVTVDEGVFEADEVPVAAGAASVVAFSRLPDGTAASHAVSVSVGSASNALALVPAPLEGSPPLDVRLELQLFVAVPAFERIDFDLDGDRILDVLDAPLRADARYPEARPYVARAYVMLPNGAELSARARIAVRAAPVILRELASGNPVDLATDADGRLHVLDAAAGSVTVYDTAGNVARVIGSSGSGTGQLASPQGVAVGPDGRVYVADTGNARVQIFESGGTFAQSITGAGSPSGVLNAPRSVAVSEDEILVVEAGTRARFFSFDGKELGALDLSNLRGAGWVSGHGLLLASPTDGILAAVSGALRSVALSDTARERLAAPIDVAAGEDGVWIVDAGTSSVIGLTDHLGYRRTIGDLPRPPIAVASGQRAEMESLFVADGQRVLEIGLPVPSPLPVVEELKSRLLAGDVGGALARIHPLQRALFEEIYADLGVGLAASAARMEAFTLERVREREAIVRIRATLMENGSPRTIQHPMHLVRAEDGTWQVFDY